MSQNKKIVFVRINRDFCSKKVRLLKEIEKIVNSSNFKNVSKQKKSILFEKLKQFSSKIVKAVHCPSSIKKYLDTRLWSRRAIRNWMVTSTANDPAKLTKNKIKIVVCFTQAQLTGLLKVKILVSNSRFTCLGSLGSLALIRIDIIADALVSSKTC